jgi:O-antigen biosynthesis protein
MHKIKSKIIRGLRFIRSVPPIKWYGMMKRRMRKQPHFYQEHFKHVVNLAAKAEKIPRKPVNLSIIVPVYNASIAHLDTLFQSVRSQKGHEVELIFSDDGSSLKETTDWLKTKEKTEQAIVVWATQNGGIAAATNAGLKRATGEWIGLLDHDDALSPYALSAIARALSDASHVKFLYTDEVIIDDKLQPLIYFLKPAFDDVLLSGMNYINHFSLYKRGRLLEIGGLREGFQGSQDHDLVLRYTKDFEPSEILHLPYPAYMWRQTETSFSAINIDEAVASARKALAEHYSDFSEEIIVTEALDENVHRVRFDLAQKKWPLVSVVIPSKDSFELISRVLTGLFEGTDYPHFDVIIIDNGSTDPQVLALYESYREKYSNFQAHVEVEAFNFSRAVNRGIGMTKGDPVLLLNNDIEILEPNWLKEMVSCLAYKNVGIVGAKLLYPNRKIQHVGVITGLGGYAGHWYFNMPQDTPGAMGRLWVRQSFSVVTGACFLLTRECFAKVGAFDEEVFPVAYNDVDYCLRATQLNVKVVWTPFSCLIHHESATRGDDESAENLARFERDKRNLLERHKTDVFEDKAFNPWYSRLYSEPFPVKLKALPRPR